MRNSQINSPPGLAVILGANGRLGMAAVWAFLAAGWRVRAFVRGVFKGDPHAALEVVSGDALAPNAVSTAAQGAQVIVNALNVPYGDWARDTPKLTHAVILAAAKTGATVVLPGNVYHFGASMPAVLSETSPVKPTHALGKIRQQMESSYRRRAPLEGFQVVILRAGDFFGPAALKPSGGWFDSHIAAKFAQGKLRYPGPLDVVHAWAYLPDLAQAMVELAQRRSALAQVETVGFPGYHLSGGELMRSLENIAGRKLKIKAMPWRFIRFASLFSATLRGVVQTEYLWRTPHAIDGAKFRELLPDFNETPLPIALAQAVRQLTNNQ
jgi:nucleoside-diphosphate-sugar epimerase